MLQSYLFAYTGVKITVQKRKEKMFFFYAVLSKCSFKMTELTYNVAIRFEPELLGCGPQLIYFLPDGIVIILKFGERHRISRH